MYLIYSVPKVPLRPRTVAHIWLAQALVPPGIVIREAPGTAQSLELCDIYYYCAIK